ncbi:MAG: class I tRNA ligase family protein, partial [Candidatus Wildermuthbacteria bacterium]|nr:class I tRNA ligase family protein [Candidatus Wildermuthbacteria bacterium]
KRFEKIYFHWIRNLHDWCISRQIWFGHRIPVWYKTEEMYVGVTPPKGEGWEQDPDALDTWFSSGLWTFSTLGWPTFAPSTKLGATAGRPSDLKTFHPTSVLETGYDILFFWVARMILMSTCLIGEVPFKTVYLHGMVRDEKGRKMSKSLGNIVNPLDMIAKYGADATRLSLIIGAAPGNDIKLSEDKTRGYRNFANKLWNIARFILMNTSDYSLRTKTTLAPGDAKILKSFYAVARRVERDVEAFQLSKAAETLYHYAWHTFADAVIEDSKPLLDDKKTKASRQALLRTILYELIKLLHPFMPFVTESIYQILPLPRKKQTIMIEQRNSL